MKKIALLLSLTLGLAACSSAPTRYYTLMPPVTEGSAAARNANLQFEMSTVRIPVQVDQPQLVVRQDSGTLAILETQWWGATLVDELRSALVDQLSNSPVQGRHSVRVDVQRFDSVPGQYALMDVEWRLRSASTGDTPG